MARKHKIGDILGRHGDVALEVAKLPDSAVRQPCNGDVVLALGEATGHAHRINDAGASVWVVGSDKYLVTEKPCILDHEEHGKVTVPPGVYKIAIETDYVPGAPPQRVID